MLGAGVMGSQIAAHLANAGLDVVLLDRDADGGNPAAIAEAAFRKMLKMKPSPVMHKNVAGRIKTGSFGKDMELIKDADWIIEVVVEQLEAKQNLLQQVIKHASPSAVISTNTSGLPVKVIASTLPADVRKRFLGTHFFNPPRYLKLLEIIPTAETDENVVQKVRDFGRIYLGKGVVTAKDTPNFIANRIGTYSMMLALRMLDKGFTIPEIDLLTGPITGKPKSATFRTADVVGLDTLAYVSKNLHKAIPHDPYRDVFSLPDVLQKLVESGRLGAKSGAGFYKKEGKAILSINPVSMEYETQPDAQLGDDIRKISKLPSLQDRWAALYNSDGRAGDFIREHSCRLTAYALHCVPEISDYPADVDKAVCLGFGWQAGPFRFLDYTGFDAFRKQCEKIDQPLPDWFHEMAEKGEKSFYKKADGSQDEETCYSPVTGYVSKQKFADEITVSSFSKPDKANEVWSNEEAGLLDTGDGILLYEFRSKANTLGFNVVNGLMEALEILDKKDFRGMILANDGANFSVGANLGELATVLQEGNFKLIEKAVHNFQKVALAIRYSSKPVVPALRGKVLGGGVELSIGAPSVVAAAESYIGLVELGAGLIPAGSGTMTLAARAADSATSHQVSLVQPFIQKAFETVAMAKVATSAHEAVELGYFTEGMLRVSMNEDRRMYIAREEVLRLSNAGYFPPAVRKELFVLGKPGYAVLENIAWQMKEAGWISAYDAHLASRLAHVLCAGSLSGAGYVHENYLIDLEREVFLSLLGEEKTQARIKSILTTNKPLRN